MSYQEPEVLARMASLWETEIDGQRGNRDRSLSAAIVRERVEEDFGGSSLGSAIIEFLEHMCALFERDQIASPRELYLCDCSLAMSTEEAGTSLPKPLVQRIVMTFPPPLLYALVGPLIGKYLTFGELVNSLLAGIAAPSHPEMIDACLIGFWLYLRKARTEGREETNRSARLAMDRVAPLVRSDNAEIRRLAENALKALRSHLT